MSEGAKSSTAAATTPAGRGSRSVSRWALLMLLVLFVATFSAIRPGVFFSMANVRLILLTQSVLVILSLAALVPMIAGEFDLSTAANLGLSGVLTVGLISRHGIAYPLAILAGLAVGVLIGVVNALVVTRMQVSSLIATLATATFLDGVTNWYTGGTVISGNIPAQFVQLGQGQWLGIPMPAWVMLLVVLVLVYLLNHTPFGRYLYAVGGNRDAARLSGLNTGRITFASFVLAGGLSGLAGVIQMAQLAAGNPGVAAPYLMRAFAACFLGATTIRVGQYNVMGTVIAVFVLAIGVTGLELLGVPFYIEPIFTGITLALAASLVRLVSRPDRGA